MYRWIRKQRLNIKLYFISRMPSKSNLIKYYHQYLKDYLYNTNNLFTLHYTLHLRIYKAYFWAVNAIKSFRC